VFGAGQTFLFDLKQETAHLWVICTDPDTDGQCLIVSLTTLKGSKDQTVILNGTDHQFLKHATSVAYAQSDLISIELLQELISSGRARMQSPMTPSITALIVDGFPASQFTKKRIVSFVRDYKLAALSRKQIE
jgi:hypothetical protein